MKKINSLTMVWGIILIVIVTLLTIFGFMYKNKSNKYKKLEEKIVEAEKKYVDAKFLYPETGKKISISVDDLIKEGYLDNLNIDEDNCTGYGDVSHNGGIFEYKGLIKCDKYTTKGAEWK